VSAPDPEPPEASADRAGDLAADLEAGPELVDTVDALAAPTLVPRERRGLMAVLARHAGTAVPRWRPGALIGWAADTLTEITPHLSVRELPVLRRHHAGLEGDPLAARLIRNAARSTGGVGAASGGLAAVKWVAPPTLVAAPVLLAAETVAVVAIEVKLLGELHRVYGASLPGDVQDVAVVLLQSWARQRGIDPTMPGVGLGAVLGTVARNELRDRLARRFGRNLTTLGPLLTGAAVAGYLNQRATRMLGQRVLADLRR
jgi:hypothetical protein